MLFSFLLSGFIFIYWAFRWDYRLLLYISYITKNDLLSFGDGHWWQAAPTSNASWQLSWLSWTIQTHSAVRLPCVYGSSSTRDRPGFWLGGFLVQLWFWCLWTLFAVVNTTATCHMYNADSCSHAGCCVSKLGWIFSSWHNWWTFTCSDVTM